MRALRHTRETQRFGLKQQPRSLLEFRLEIHKNHNGKERHDIGSEQSRSRARVHRHSV